jgi:hypothetical protein
MLHASVTPIALCFVYTSWHFYAFSGTNLLMRCHSASSLFPVIFVFQKSYTWNILGIGRNKARSSYFPPHETESKAETEEDQEVATPPGGAGPPLAAPPPGVVPLDITPPPIKSLRRKNPRSTGVFLDKVPQRRRHRRRSSGDRSLYSGTLPGWGIAPGAISIDSTTIFIAVVVSYDEEGVVLPRGWELYR